MSLPAVRLPSTSTEALSGRLQDRVILVTGASGGLGRAVAMAAAQAGATLVLLGRHERPLARLYDRIEAAGGAQPALVPLDMEKATPDQYREVADMIADNIGRLDGIVHAAAHFKALTPMFHHAPDEWLRTLHINVSAPFALTQACEKLLTDAEDSAVVFITDDPREVATAHWGAYGVSKAAIERMASIWHDEQDTGPMRIHVVRPGPMRTQLRARAWYHEDASLIPTPEATAHAVVRVLSDEGRQWRGMLLDLTPAFD